METTIINTAFHEVCQKAKAKADELRQAKTNKELFEVLTPILDNSDFEVKTERSMEFNNPNMTVGVTIAYKKDPAMFIRSEVSTPLNSRSAKSMARAEDRATKTAMFFCLGIPLAD